MPSCVCEPKVGAIIRARPRLDRSRGGISVPHFRQLAAFVLTGEPQFWHRVRAIAPASQLAPKRKGGARLPSKSVLDQNRPAVSYGQAAPDFLFSNRRMSCQSNDAWPAVAVGTKGIVRHGAPHGLMLRVTGFNAQI
jgi:hypothetical protein